MRQPHLILFVCLLAALSSAAEPPFDGTDISGIESIVEMLNNPEERWRKQANERIKKHRMADLRLTLIDRKTNQPAEGAIVRVRQTRHAFRFGGVASAKSMSRGQGDLTGEEYKDLFLNFGFNAAGFNNAFKYKFRKGFEPYTAKQLDWFKLHEIPVRGHCLIWPGRENMTKEMTDLVNECRQDPSKRNLTALEKMCEQQVEAWAEKWDVFEWDVINEPRGNFQVAELIGEEAYAEWFRIARRYSVQRKAGLYLNENRVVSDPDPAVESKKFTEYVETVKQLLKDKAPITGLGVQSRFHAMTDADTIFERLEKLAEFDLPIAATEFEIGSNIKDDLDKAIMAERVMTTFFSHPLVNGIYAWTLLPSSHDGESGREIFHSNGTPNLRGKVWLYLMKQHWWTNETLTASSTGNASVRGFLGDYEITIEFEGRTKVITHTLDQRFKETIRI